MNKYTTGIQARPPLLGPRRQLFVVWESISQMGASWVFAAFRGGGHTDRPRVPRNAYRPTISARHPWRRMPPALCRGLESTRRLAPRHLCPRTRAGRALRPDFRVNTLTPNNQFVPAIAADSVGNFVVVWVSPQDGFNGGVFGQRYSVIVPVELMQLGIE